MAIAWATNCFSNVVKQVAHFFTLEKNDYEIPLYDFSNFGQDPGCWLLFFENDLSYFLEERLPFSEIHKWVKLAFRGTTPLQPHAILRLLRKNVDQMALKDGIRVLSEIVLPHLDPKCNAFKKDSILFMDLLGKALSAGHTQEVERALAAVSSFFPIIQFSPKVLEFLKIFNVLVKQQGALLSREKKVSFFKACTSDNQVQIISQSVLKNKMMTSNALLKVCVGVVCLFSLFSQGLGSSISRAQFGKELAQRNISFMQKGKFSLQLCLISYQICKLNIPCNLPLNLRSFDCENWNLNDVDFSYIKAPFSQFISNYSCPVTRGKFFESDFRNSTFKKADFSGSEIHLSAFDGPQGAALFSKVYAQNGSWRNLRGDFDFSFSDLQECDFAQDFSDFIARIPSENANYTFTGARIDKGQFHVIYPLDKASYKHITEFKLSLFAAPSPQGTVIKNSDFKSENYNASAEGFYPLEVHRYFYLNDTVIENSVIGTANNTALPYEKIQLFYGGRLNNVSFPSNFSFPSESYEACLGFNLYDVSACGFNYLNQYSAKCLAQNCLKNNVFVDNNMTLVHAQFSAALEKWEPQYIKDGLFDVRRYLEKQGVYSIYEWMSPYFLDGAKKPYNRLLFSAMAINSLNSFKAINVSFTNTVVDRMSTIIFVGNSYWENSTFSLVDFHLVGELHEFINSSFYDAGLTFFSNKVNIKNSDFNKTSIDGNISYLIIAGLTSENTDVWGEYGTVDISNSYLKSFGVCGYKNLTLQNTSSDSFVMGKTPRDSISKFSQSVFLNISVEIERCRNYVYGPFKASFDRVEELHLKLSKEGVSWRVEQVKKLNLQWEEVYVKDVFFTNVDAITGEWKEGGLSPGVESFIGINATFVNMTFNEALFPCSLYDYSEVVSKIKKCLEYNGFGIGRNVKFINYKSTRRWSYLALGVTGSIVAVSLICFVIYRKCHAGAVVPPGVLVAAGGV